MPPLADPSAEAQQHIGQERRPDLPAYGVGIASQEVGQLKGLLDLFEKRAATYTSKLNAELFVVFLKSFMRCQSGKVFLVVDGHPAHKAKLVQGYVQSL